MTALSPAQFAALKALDRSGFVRVSGGWRAVDGDYAVLFTTQTLLILGRRGLARFRFRKSPGRARRPTAAFISRDGRRALEAVRADAVRAAGRCPDTLPLPFAVETDRSATA